MLISPEHIVEALIARGARLDEIEAQIDELPVDAERRSALWLLAWATATNPANRRRVITDNLARLDEGPAQS